METCDPRPTHRSEPLGDAANAPPHERSLSFIEVAHPDPHRQRAREIRAAHPEVRSLYGRNPHTAWMAAAVVAGHLGMAAALTQWEAPWYVGLTLAWCLGAFMVHALFVVIHEACHRLVFRARWGNRALMLLANVPAVVPFAMALGHFHLVHHRAQGQVGRDPDLPTEGEARIFGRGRMKWLWHLLFPLLQLGRVNDDPRDQLSLRDPWLIANVATQLAVGFAAVAWLTGGALLYLGASLYFMFALHPLSGRFIQEHVIEGDHDGVQETSSYYGALNKVSFNFGYHTEHHDFPAVPWHRLPALRTLAPEFYEGRRSYRSWGVLWLRFLFDPSFSPDARVVRPIE